MNITSANAVYTLSIATLFTSPVQLQQFAAEDIFTTEPLASAETVMGVDGHLSAGFVFVPVVQQINLQADSESIDVMDQWWLNSQLNKTIYPAQGIIVLPAINQKWAMNNGFLTSYPPIPNAAKILQPRRFAITWESVSPAPV